jgi:hypothetical protein
VSWDGWTERPLPLDYGGSGCIRLYPAEPLHTRTFPWVVHRTINVWDVVGTVFIVVFFAVAVAVAFVVVLPAEQARCDELIRHTTQCASQQIQSGVDVFYWAVTTITTTGYGDKVPFTSEGKLYAAMLMLVGVVGFGFLVGFFVTRFDAQLARRERQLDYIRNVRAETQDLDTSDAELLRAGIGDLSARLAQIEAAVARDRPSLD